MTRAYKIYWGIKNFFFIEISSSGIYSAFWQRRDLVFHCDWNFFSQIKCYSIYWFCQYLFWLPYSYFLFNSIVIRRFARKFFSFFLFYWKADFLFPFPRILFSSVFFCSLNTHRRLSVCLYLHYKGKILFRWYWKFEL